MSTRQTRRQAAQAAQREASSPSSNSDPATPQQDKSAALMNGNGKAHASAPPDPADLENIFLFWPNIIGKASKPSPPSLLCVLPPSPPLIASP